MGIRFTLFSKISHSSLILSVSLGAFTPLLVFIQLCCVHVVAGSQLLNRVISDKSSLASV